MVATADLNLLAKSALDAAFLVHTELGPGLLESTYKACLVQELQSRGVAVCTEVPCPVVYRGVKLTDIGYRMDLLVEGQLVVEIKSVDALAPVHRAQLLSYLKHSRLRLGLLLNFNIVYLKDGIVRMVNGL